ncbi:MAG: DUF4433 domain-containing protein [Armatimonadetes bacterium]|nr:MAG: DUF4433 domain-containing protein [Armatimonadota bacterium]
MARITELHYITPIENVASILKRGILSHNKAARVPHTSISMQEVQARRAAKVLPGRRRLHSYANLYFNARNPMMYVRKHLHETICVLRVKPGVMQLPGVMISNKNAACTSALFLPYPEGLQWVDFRAVFAERWDWRTKSLRCAEVLVPHRVPVEFISGVYVSCASSRKAVAAVAPHLPIRVDARLFFRDEVRYLR